MKLHFTTSDHHQQQPLQHKNKTYNHTLTQTRQFGPRLMTWHDTPWKGIQRQCSSDMANIRQLIQKIILKEHQRLAKWRQRDTRLRDVLWCQQKRKMHAEQCYIIILFFVLCFCVSALSGGTEEEEEESYVFNLALSICCTVISLTVKRRY